jgi:MYXO-CTERM domain-containing protein
MAYDGSSSKVVVFGGWDMATTGSKNDMWDWDPTTGSWTEVLTGTETGIPGSRSYASMVFDGTRSRLEMVAGMVTAANPAIGVVGLIGSNEVWEMNPATLTFTDRSVAYQGPAARAYHAMAYCPATGKVYVAGGLDPLMKVSALTDLWEWNGSTWNEVVTDQSPPPRIDGAMAYDPARRSLILFGGTSWSSPAVPNDTWEWSASTRQWTQLVTNGSPDARWGHAMVTDTARNKILLFGGSGSNGAALGDVWEWDGATLTWTNRTPVTSSSVPAGRAYPVMSFDETRGKLVLYDGSRSLSVAGESTSAFWEWDVVTGGWALRDPQDTLSDTSNVYAVYDPARRRHVFLTDASVNGVFQTWELDAKSQTWYVRSLANAPGGRFRSAMTYDSGRQVAVLFGGIQNSSAAAPGGGATNDVWEYAVTNLANGEGCTAASAADCASGFCVDGVCCESAGCTGACMACNTPGSEGTCVLAQAGTEVPGSCSDGQACDGTGSCKSKNGQACSAAGNCASGFCVDGVCCDDACTGVCKSCNLPGQVGTCTAQSAGTDPNGECGLGTGVCRSTCDGVGVCTFPLGGVSCGACLTCDGAGTCSRPDPACSSGGTGGKGIPGKDSGGSTGWSSGGGGGSTNQSGGSGGSSSGGAGSSGSGGATTLASGGGGAPSSGGGATSSAEGGSGGTALAGAGGASRDAGNPAKDGAARDSTGGGGASGGAPGPGIDSGLAALDGGRAAADGGLVAKLHRGGCSCGVGEDVPSKEGPLPWIFVAGAGLLARRRRSTRPQG